MIQIAGLSYSQVMRPTATASLLTSLRTGSVSAPLAQHRPPAHRWPHSGPIVRFRRGWPTVRVGFPPPGSEAWSTHTSNQVVVYLHGGAYVLEITPLHWMGLADLEIRSGAAFVVPIYPLAPYATASTTVPTAAAIVRDVMHEYGAENVTLMGDSAGGGMALAVAQQLGVMLAPQPRQIVLISPWVDVSMDNPEIKRIENRDLVLRIPGLAQLAHTYAGKLPLRHPMVSPLFGDMTGLAPMTVFAGTYEMLHPDITAFVEAARAAGVDVDYHEQQRAQHNYALGTNFQGRRARADIAELLAPKEAASDAA